MLFKILVAEDEEITMNNILETMKEEGYSVSGTGNGSEALKMLGKDHFDVLITDIKMPGMNGIELLSAVKTHHPETAVIIITGFGSIDSAVEAMKKGAYDYITKPFNLDELSMRVRKIYEQKLLQKENVALRTFLTMDKKVSIIAKSEAMRNILGTVDELKNSDINILLTGETGVGKSLLAKLIHFTSKRQNMPFLSINCATLTEELLASELFGYERGAFSGAVTSKQGLVEIADTGTLFLDEITELSTNLQAKLLKIVEEGEFFRVGGTKPIRVDVRFIAASNQNLKQLISEGRFREDLYYRLNVMELYIEPLRDRTDDIKPLCSYFLQKHLPKSSKKITGYTEDTMDILMHYSFPGNVRELENIIERAIILEKTPLITPDSLPTSIRLLQIETLDSEKVMTVDELIRGYAEKVLKMYGGNRTKAAEVMGMSRTSLWKILKED